MDFSKVCWNSTLPTWRFWSIVSTAGLAYPNHRNLLWQDPKCTLRYFWDQPIPCRTGRSILCCRLVKKLINSQSCPNLSNEPPASCAKVSTGMRKSGPCPSALSPTDLSPASYCLETRKGQALPLGHPTRPPLDQACPWRARQAAEEI